MQRAIVIIVCIVVVNFLILSIGYGQTNINIQAIVPQTEANKNITTDQVQTTTKENIYQYYFEKGLSQKDTIDSRESQTIYDRVASYLLMAALMFVVALLSMVTLKIIEYYRK
jgi:hypothetical protein